MTENTINPITTLNINGEEIEAKAVFAFDHKAKQFARDEQDENGKTTKVSGFNAIYNSILERDSNAIADFWECATAYLNKKAPTREQIETALMEFIDNNGDTLELLQGALDVMNNSGFFKQKSRMFWTQMNSAPSMVKEEEKESTKNGIEFMKNNYKEIMGELPY
ncbi:tail assembly chaperone [Staphylococcus warneri]|uniref:tail assembly chaperone n=1 Tax=Staphylococcus warneri TaxID=1292 RepID=UPI0031DF4CFD